MVVALALIGLIVGTVSLLPRPQMSSAVYCGIIRYTEFPAQTIVTGVTVNTTVVMTTTVDFTASTTPGPIGHTYSNSSTSSDGLGYSSGIETICRYLNTTRT